MTLDMSDIMQK